MKRRELGIYVHIPFCVRKCNYCDFLSFPASRQTQERYCDALKAEIRQFPYAAQYEVVSVFFGGGTPSLPDPHLTAGVLDVIRDSFLVRKDAEITIECNPGTLSDEKLSVYHEAGFNRLSIGLQSADNTLLGRLGRIHTWEVFAEEYRAARSAGFSNISVDLMYGLPGQTCALWEETLRRVLSLPNDGAQADRPTGPEHISAYSLIIEEGTPFWDMYHEDALTRARGDRPLFLPDESSEAQMQEDLQRMLQQAGMHRYEISNYALPGRESRHNVGYWIRREYAGFGLGASGQIAAERIRNTADLSEYLNTGGRVAEHTCLTRENEIEETMFLGLRMMEGVDLDRFAETFSVRAEDLYADVIGPLAKQNLLIIEEGHLKLTQRGIDVSNLVMAEFLLE